LERWVLSLQEFSFSVQHKEGVANPADVPSRYPVTSIVDPTGARLDEEGQFKRVLPKVRFATEELRQKAIQEFIDGTSVETVAGVAAALTVGDGWDSAQTEVARAVAACQCVGWVSGAVPAVAAAVQQQTPTACDLEDQEEPAEDRQLRRQLRRWAGNLVQDLPGEADAAEGSGAAGLHAELAGG
jgi:hypothetical protein